MKAVPKVNTDGLYMEDALVDDAFNGVVPFYAAPEEVADAATPGDEQTGQPKEGRDPEEEQPREVAGYTVGIPVTPGLFRPRFDLTAWQTYQEAVTAAQQAYADEYDEWQSKPEEERGDAPVYEAPEQPELWIEGLTPEEIDAILNPPKDPDAPETDAEKIARLEQSDLDNKELIAALYEMILASGGM